MAVAAEQEMTKVQDMRAKVIEAEAEVQLQWQTLSKKVILVLWIIIKCKIYNRYRNEEHLISKVMIAKQILVKIKLKCAFTNRKRS